MNPVRCDFCYRYCMIEEGGQGFCTVRENHGGTLVTNGYASVVAMGVDPVEKKPLYHFYPGTKTFSLALFGCNLRCTFCQNYQISQPEYKQLVQRRPLPAREAVELALKEGCPSISFTYSEPLVWQDYLMEVSLLAREAGLKTIMVTNGTFSKEALDRLEPIIDAFNIDVKGSDAFYRNYTGGRLKPVLDGIQRIAQGPSHLEVTTMVMEKVHTIEEICMIAAELKKRSVQVWHLSRYFPRYREHTPQTSEAYLQQVWEAVQDKGIPFVYRGNSDADQTTYCPHCHRALAVGWDKGDAHATKAFQNGHCTVCNTEIYGRFDG